MFVSHARVRIVGLGGRSKKRGPQRRRLAVKEVVRMPCLLPTSITIVLGLLAVAAGAGMSVIGYDPKNDTQTISHFDLANATMTNPDSSGPNFYTRKICYYTGPIIMAIGMFAMIVACVFYCEILDKYAILVPDKRGGATIDKDELYQVIVGEMKKSYAQTLITIYSKAAERNLFLDNQSSSGDYLPEAMFPMRTTDLLTLEQQIDIECEGYTPSPPIPNKSYSVIQARIQRLRSEDNWLKTSSLPNIRRMTSLRRAGRVGAKIVDSRTLSYDYTMDEARLRRKSMMLRSIVQWNSGSSDLFTQRQRRFSSVKALPSDHRRSFEDLLQPGYGSFPLTRLIQRRGTFACGDMRTRRMKFLLLLEASESQEGFNDPMSPDSRPEVNRIRRNSFIPYTTCDRFITGEERKTIRDRRRSSVNPFTFGNRFGQTVPQPGTRRHSFFPIRREDKIFASDTNEHRRHSFNPIRVSNTMKSEYAGQKDDRRNPTNSEGHFDKSEEMRPLDLPPQDSRFLQIPGYDPYMEGRPSETSGGSVTSPQHAQSSPGFCNPQAIHQECYDSRQGERRHSFNPVVRLSPGSSAAGERTQHNVPKITVSEDLSPSGRYLTVPAAEFPMEERERRHSFNPPLKSHAMLSHSASVTMSDMPGSQRISFKLGLNTANPSSVHGKPRPRLRASKPSSEPVSLSNYSQEMVVLEPRAYSGSTSVSPCSNVSCCGSERVESDVSAAASRTTSISSERSTKTTLTMSPVSVIATDGFLSYGTFQPRPSSLKTSSSGRRTADGKSKKLQTPILSPATLELDFPSADVCASSGSGFVRKCASVRDSRDRRKYSHKGAHVVPSGSPSSRPATLYLSAITDANAALQRSKSASALPWDVVQRPQTPRTKSSYASTPTPPSPHIRHTPPTEQKTDDKS